MLEVVYSSGASIWDKELLSTLAVFYDRVHLPFWSYSEPSRLLTYRKSPDGYRFDKALVIEVFDDRVEKWDRLNMVLYEQGALVRLPRPPDQSEEDSLKRFGEVSQILAGAEVVWEESFEEKRKREETWEKQTWEYEHSSLLSSSHFWELLRDLKDLEANYSKQIRPNEASVGCVEMYMRHLVRQDVAIPRMFIANDSAGRQTLNTLLANSLLKAVVPRLSSLHPEDLLTVREEVKGTREGFAMHLQALTAEVEARIKDGDSVSEITRYASSIVDTKLIPDFYEFRRQLAAKRAGFWGDVLDKAGRIAEIDCAPWTPKFYAQLAVALGLSTLKGIGGQESQLSNRVQAFQMLRTLEKQVLP